jgi:hypothetical protein
MAAGWKARFSTRTGNRSRAPPCFSHRTGGRADLFKSTTSDQHGHYEFTAITPGDYKLFAWEDIEPNSWNDPGFLKDYEKQSEKTTLEPKARATVSLHLTAGPDAQ